MVRSVQLRSRGLTVVVPDMARSAATILCLGAHHILMGPGGDLGPIGPQMLFPGGDGKPAVASAKEVVAAVAEAEERIKVNPDSFPLPLFLPAVRLAVVRCHHVHGRAGQGCAVALRGVDAGGLEGPGAQRGGRAVDWPPNTRGTAHRCACQPLCGDLCRSCGRLWPSC
ncbi:hypothetical protein [Propionibacterium acidifaciens]|uniref:hypothetical protein n=1 Tax=Propionibacterium acidifaciens TaxID=556499 RepID=UPI00360F688D